MSEILELSVEETNALRAKLGLPPLRVVAPEDTAVATEAEAVRARIAESKNKRKILMTEEDDDGDEEEEEVDDNAGISADKLQQVSDGTVLVLDDVNVLGNGKNKKKTAELVLPGTRTKNDDDDATKKETKGKNRKKTDKRNFIAAFARSSDAAPNGEDLAPKAIPGARLFESDLAPVSGTAINNEEELNTKKRKKAKKSAVPEQVKIIRRQIYRGSVTSGFTHDDDDDNVTESKMEPRIYGKVENNQEDDDEDDEFEASLSRARKVNLNKPSVQEMLTQIRTANSFVPEDGDVYVPASDFVRIVAANVEAKPSTAPLTEDNNNTPIVSKTEPDQYQEARLFEKPPEPLKEKTHRRSLAATLSVVRESMEERDEIIVGRANDARPLTDMNKPDDLVKLEYRDDHGRLLTQKEAYRQLKYQFRGEGPGAKKKEKRERQLQREQAARSDASGAAGHRGVKDLIQGVKKDHIVLWKN